MARFLVTGGAGFIGSNLVDALLANGDSVRVLDDFSSGYEENLSHVFDRVEILRGDVADPKICVRAVQGCDYVLHEAALASVPASVEDPVKNHRINVDGTLALLLASRDAGVKRFVLASSAATYGDGPESPKIETMPPAPVSPYASAKLIGEVYCRQFTAAGWLDCVCLRYFNIFGPRQDPGSDYAAVVPIFIRTLLDGRRPVIYGDGEQTRDFTYVANVVEANLLATQHDSAVGGVFNIGCGGSYSVRELHEKIRDALGVDIEPRFEPVRAGDVKDSKASIEAAREGLGYEPVVSFADGLARTCEWFRKEHAAEGARR
ncbi:MAG: SDR family oxidoreductase [Gemmatimonadetes bacterium]|nr:SDR family oxidoreductase [Gemmatimonadota bacterium]